MGSLRSLHRPDPFTQTDVSNLQNLFYSRLVHICHRAKGANDIYNFVTGYLERVSSKLITKWRFVSTPMSPTELMIVDHWTIEIDLAVVSRTLTYIICIEDQSATYSVWMG
jgi:hypothetical protein